MGSLFRTPKISTPAVQQPQLPPVVETDDAIVKQKLKKGSYSSTIITGDLAPQTSKKSILG